MGQGGGSQKPHQHAASERSTRVMGRTVDANADAGSAAPEPLCSLAGPLSVSADEEGSSGGVGVAASAAAAPPLLLGGGRADDCGCCGAAWCGSCGTGGSACSSPGGVPPPLAAMPFDAAAPSEAGAAGGSGCGCGAPRCGRALCAAAAALGGVNHCGESAGALCVVTALRGSTAPAPSSSAAACAACAAARLRVSGSRRLGRWCVLAKVEGTEWDGDRGESRRCGQSVEKKPWIFTCTFPRWPVHAQQQQGVHRTRPYPFPSSPHLPNVHTVGSACPAAASSP
eukprot:356200-Chlamydomonas_euryale.AAC.4